MRISRFSSLGFERKARLFCDVMIIISFKCFFDKKLGFERKARLFCDLEMSFPFLSPFFGWDLSGRLGYFVTGAKTFFTRIVLSVGI